MRTFLLISLLALGHQQIPKSNPNGVWRAESGLEFELRLVGTDVEARMVAGSNPRYLEYEIDLIGTEEPNTYKGTGHFKAKLANGRECEFDTDWHIVVVSDDRIIGVGSRIVPDPDTCEIVEKGDQQVDLQRKN